MAGATTLAALVLGVCVCVASGKPVSAGDVRGSGESSNAGDLLTNDKQIMSSCCKFSETIKIGAVRNTPCPNDEIDEKTREQSKNEISTSISNNYNDGGSQNNHDERIKRSRRSYHDVDRWEGRNYRHHDHHGRSGRYTRRDDYYEDRYNGRGRRGGERGRGGSSYEDYSGESDGRGRGRKHYENHRGEGTSVGGGGKGLLAGGGGFGIDLGQFKVIAGGGGSPLGKGDGHAEQHNNH